MTQYGNIVYVA